LYSYEEEEKKIEKVNEDIEMYQMQIHVGKSTYDKAAYLYLVLSKFINFY
jgi:hypothetical protein